ncbi:MAG: FkbM family methyltransferase [Pseudomonadota bacterium]
MVDVDPLQGLDTQSAFGTHRPGFFQRLVWQLSDHRRLSQGLRQKLRKHFARPVAGPFDITHDGMKFRLYPAENYCDRVLFGRDDLPERVEHEALVPLIAADTCFVDIGANVGSYTLFVGRRAGPQAKLVALEPHPRTHAKLLYNLRANGLPTAHVFNGGAGPERAQMDLWSDGGSNIGHTSMLKEGTANPVASVSVPVVPLMDLLAGFQIDRIDILKIDIEGFEDRALMPFFDAAPEALLPKHVLIEVAHAHLWKADLMGRLDELGYQEVFWTEENRLLSR